MFVSLYIPSQSVVLNSQDELSKEQLAAIWENVRKKANMMVILHDQKKEKAKVSYSPTQDEYHNYWNVEMQNCETPEWGTDGYKQEQCSWMDILTPYETCTRLVQTGWA